MSTDDANRTNLASNKIQTSRSWNYWFERATSNSDMAACRFLGYSIDTEMAKMDNKDLREKRKEWFSQMEVKLKEMHTKEDDSLFYYHSSEDRIVLSHAMFWTMTQLQFFKSKLRKEKFFLLLRQYQEEMLDAFLQDDDYFSELLHYCNIMYEMLPTILMASYLKIEKDTPKLAAISMVAAGYAGDMPEELANELLDDMDFDKYGKVKCRAIEQLMPQLMRMVENEERSMR